MVKFIHTADIHLDSPLRGLARYEGAPAKEIRSATRRALEKLVLLATEEQVDFVLIAGDLYDGDWKDHSTGLFFVRQMGRLREAGIPVYINYGNHDAVSKITKHLRMPENVHVFSAKQPETMHLENVGVAIHGQSFITGAVTENLSRQYPGPISGNFNIGLLHTSLDGREEHDQYAPCRADALQNHGYDYWALGHVHQREKISDNPAIHFPGNLQGRHIRESGEKGVLLVTADTSHDITVDFRCMDVFRWAPCSIDLTGISDWNDALVAAGRSLKRCIEAAEGIPVAVRFIATGSTDLHEVLLARHIQWVTDLRALANDIGNDQVWVEKTPISTDPPKEVAPVSLEGPLATIDLILSELQTGSLALTSFNEALKTLHMKLPSDMHHTQEQESLFSGDKGVSLLEDIRALLLDRLQREVTR